MREAASRRNLNAVLLTGASYLHTTVLPPRTKYNDTVIFYVRDELELVRVRIGRCVGSDPLRPLSHTDHRTATFVGFCETSWRRWRLVILRTTILPLLIFHLLAPLFCKLSELQLQLGSAERGSTTAIMKRMGGWLGVPKSGIASSKSLTALDEPHARRNTVVWSWNP